MLARRTSDAPISVSLAFAPRLVSAAHRLDRSAPGAPTPFQSPTKLEYAAAKVGRSPRPRTQEILSPPTEEASYAPETHGEGRPAIEAASRSARRPEDRHGPQRFC